MTEAFTPRARKLCSTLLLFHPLSACAHNTEGIGAAILFVLGWPVATVICAMLAVRGRRLLTGIGCALTYPAAVYLVNRVAQPFASGSWSREYLLSEALALAFYVLVFASLHARRSGRGGIGAYGLVSAVAVLPLTALLAAALARLAALLPIGSSLRRLQGDATFGVELAFACVVCALVLVFAFSAATPSRVVAATNRLAAAVVIALLGVAAWLLGGIVFGYPILMG